MSDAGIKIDTPDQSDLEGDTYEDAPDSLKKTSPEMSRTRSSTSSRSLTERPTSRESLGGRSESVPDRHSPAATADPPRSVPAEDNSEALETPRQPKRISEVDDEAHADPKPSGSMAQSEQGTEATENIPLATPKTATRTSASFQEVELSNHENVEGTEPAEPAESAVADERRGRKLSVDSRHSPKSSASHSKSRSTSRVPSISEKVASVTHASTFSLGSWGASKSSHPGSSGAPKKMSGPWGWLSRKKTAPENVTPAQPIPHRSSTSTSTGSNKLDLKLHRLETETVSAKDQLKERFKLARMKEEAGINVDQLAATPRSSVASGTNDANGSNSRPISENSHDVQSPTSTTSEAAVSSSSEQIRRGHKARAPSLAQSITVDTSLAPGTVSGLNAGLSSMADPELPVDWDLWQALVYEGPAAVAKTSPAELGRSIASGIPNPIRGVVWQVLAQSKDEVLEEKYRELVLRGTEKEIVLSPGTALPNPPHSAKSPASNDNSREQVMSSASSVHSEASGVTSPVAASAQDAEKDSTRSHAERQKKQKEDSAALKKLEKVIRKDLGARSNYAKYFAAKEMQDDLFNVCKAYALYDEPVGYAQGMNFIVMPILFNMPPEEAFCLLVRLMNQYRLRDTFTQEMPGLHKQLYQFEKILEEVDTKLCRHLTRRGVAPSLYATQWFMTLFAYKFPLQLVLRVYDLVLSEGLESAILKFGIALMLKNSDRLQAIQDMAALKTFLNERLFDVYIDSAPSSHSILEQGFFGSSGGSEKDVYRADLLVQDACAVSLSTETLQAYADEFEANKKAESDRQTELEELRANVASQSLKIKSLEERVEKSDTEHVQITQEMIRSRMENEELKTAAMEQLAEIEKLKKQLEDAPGQVETSLKEEMERTMARNTEVQSQNRVLEEQMTEMEKNLVETKMQFAQVNGDYDALKQKWSDLRRALGD